MVDTQNLIDQNMRLARELKQRIDQLAAIGTIAAAVSQSLDLDLTLQTALQAVLDVVGAEAGGISLIDEQAGEVVLRAQQGWSGDFVNDRPMRIPLGQGLSGQVISNDSVIVRHDLDESEQFAVQRFAEERFRSLAMAPMHARGKVVGILSIMSSRPYRFDDETIGVLRAVADTVGVALDNARLYEASVENEFRMSAILHSTADGIIATDQSGRIRLINQTAQDMLSIDGDGLIGAPLREAPIHPTVRNSLLFALSSRSEDSNKIFQAQLDSGTILSVLVSPVYVETQVDQTEETDGWVIVLQDVTHLRQAEMARTQFIQAAAHDMRNPLGVTLNSLDMLDKMVSDDPTAQEIVDIAVSGVTRIQDLIDDLLNLEHIESGYGFNLAEVPLGDIVDEVAVEIRPSLDEKGLQFTIDVPPRLPTLQLDRKWIVRAIMNYLDNACKYVPSGGQVVLRMFVNEPMLHIEVSDDGPGVPPEAQVRLFERFYRANTDRDVPGTGLGLAIVKSVAEAHGGSVYVRSRPGQGSTFGLTILLTTADRQTA